MKELKFFHTPFRFWWDYGYFSCICPPCG